MSDGKDVNVGRFTDDYKPQAVDLVASSGRSIGSVAKELGLRDSVLRRWVELRGSQLRLWFASMAYVLTCALRRIGLDKTVFADATCGIIRLKLLKNGALIRISVRRIRVPMASACPAAN